MREPDAAAIVVLVLVFGIGAGLDLTPGPAMTYSLTCDTPSLNAGTYSFELPESSVEISPLWFSGREVFPEIEIEFDFVDPEIGIGPI